MEKLIDIDHVTTAYGNKTVLRAERGGEDDLAEGYTRPFAACLRRDPLL